ncbi:enoyl-CoA hydratase/isomerase family protein [soil metagenome]
MKTATGFVQTAVEAGVFRITLARPPLNVCTTAMLDELADALGEAAREPDARLVLLTGAGNRAFCAGVDVADHTADRVAAMMAAFQRAVFALLDCELPVVAALNGAALGGGLELALAADIVLARENAALGQPEVRLGVFPPAAAALLPRLIGRQRALELMLTGRLVRTGEAFALGLVTHVLPADDFEDRVREYVATIVVHSAPVLRLARRAVHEGLELEAHDAIRHADRIYLDELMQLQDPHEGLAAYVEKREPVWRHR